MSVFFHPHYLPNLIFWSFLETSENVHSQRRSFELANDAIPMPGLTKFGGCSGMPFFGDELGVTKAFIGNEGFF